MLQANSREMKRLKIEVFYVIYSKSLFHLQTLSIVLKRDNRGLGFSIAGGFGSTPFKGNDPVSFYSVQVESVISVGAFLLMAVFYATSRAGQSSFIPPQFPNFVLSVFKMAGVS